MATTLEDEKKAKEERIKDHHKDVMKHLRSRVAPGAKLGGKPGAKGRSIAVENDLAKLANLPLKHQTS
jgi:hypothetical protein